MRIPFLDLPKQNNALKQELDAAIQKVLDEGPLIGGKFVKSFEANFSDYHALKHCISTGNGTDSLFAAMKINGIGAGDEVITPAWSWISTSETISLAGGKPVFADVEPTTFTLSIPDVERKITNRTKAIIVVHLYGQCCDMTALQKICSQHNLILIEDCAQAHGAKQNEKLAGTFGNIGSFSFYPTKNLGALGDAGCLLTNDDEIAARLRRFVNHGGLAKDEHIFEGMNSRMDAIQSAVLDVKLKYLNAWNERRRDIAQQYMEQLMPVETIQLPTVANNNEHVFHLFVIRSTQRDALKKHLAEKSIETLIHYPKALPFQPAYSNLGFKPNDFKVAYLLQHEVLSLPCNPCLTGQEVEYICEVIKAF